MPTIPELPGSEKPGQPNPKHASAAMRRSVKVFFLFCAIYLLTWGGHYTSGDGAQKIAWANVMLFGTSTEMNRGPSGEYSKYGIGHSLIAMPPLAAAAFILKHTGIRCEAALYTLIFVVNGALLLALIAYYLFQFYEPGPVWWTVVFIGLSSTWWPYTKMDYSEPLVATILFAGFLLMRLGHPMAGMLLASSIITIRTGLDRARRLASPVVACGSSHWRYCITLNHA